MRFSPQILAPLCAAILPAFASPLFQTGNTWLYEYGGGTQWSASTTTRSGTILYRITSVTSHGQDSLRVLFTRHDSTWLRTTIPGQEQLTYRTVVDSFVTHTSAQVNYPRVSQVPFIGTGVQPDEEYYGTYNADSMMVLKWSSSANDGSNSWSRSATAMTALGVLFSSACSGTRYGYDCTTLTLTSFNGNPFVSSNMTVSITSGQRPKSVRIERSSKPFFFFSGNHYDLIGKRRP